MREFKNVVERNLILAPEGDIDITSLPEEFATRGTRIIREIPLNDGEPGGDFLASLREFAQDYIRKVLAAGNNKTQAARIFVIHPTSLLRRLKKRLP